jgi:hypothetical protein
MRSNQPLERPGRQEGVSCSDVLPAAPPLSYPVRTQNPALSVTRQMDENPQAVCFFNNCRNRDHIALYGSGAFFDLGNSAKQAAQARDLVPGQTCVVGAYADDGRVVFSWYSFTHEALLPDEHSNPVRVFFGRFVASERLPKSQAARSVHCSALFRRTGDFKLGSVFWQRVPLAARPVGAQNADPDTARASKQPHHGAGFGDPLENRLVEAMAIRAVKKKYQQDGWSVRSVEREKCGFDLECSKNGVVEDVEVKGVRGSDPCFIITAGEVEQARNNANFFFIVVTSALSPSRKLTKYSGLEFCRRFKLFPIQYRAVVRS